VLADQLAAVGDPKLVVYVVQVALHGPGGHEHATGPAGRGLGHHRRTQRHRGPDGPGEVELADHDLTMH
jgi:hypothetical protein